MAARPMGGKLSMGRDGGGETVNDRTILSRTQPGFRERSAAMIHCIVVAEGSEAGRKQEIGLEPITLGRHGDNQLSLSDPCVSGHHCTIRFEDGALWVTDCGSTNGTYIDGERVQGRTEWPIAATLAVGEQVLRHEYRRRAEIQQSDDLKNDLRRAAAYVESLLPRPLRSGPIVTAWHFLPSTELGGDIFDYFWLDAEHFVFYLLDVSGHGVGAALHSVSVFNLLRQRSLPHTDFTCPAQVMNTLNEALSMERYGSMYFTLWYGVYHLPRRALSFASAGHPPALLFSDDRRRRFDLMTDNPPIGVSSDHLYRQDGLSLNGDAEIWLYSDGVYEVPGRDGDMGSWDEFARGLGETLRKVTDQPEAIFRGALEKTPSKRFDDDFSLVMVKIRQ
jgi:serine phosphatase RsbU (regulator of sigma subunit)